MICFYKVSTFATPLRKYTQFVIASHDAYKVCDNIGRTFRPHILVAAFSTNIQLSPLHAPLRAGLAGQSGACSTNIQLSPDVLPGWWQGPSHFVRRIDFGPSQFAGRICSCTAQMHPAFQHGSNAPCVSVRLKCTDGVLQACRPNNAIGTYKVVTRRFAFLSALQHG